MPVSRERVPSEQMAAADEPIPTVIDPDFIGFEDIRSRFGRHAQAPVSPLVTERLYTPVSHRFQPLTCAAKPEPENFHILNHLGCHIEVCVFARVFLPVSFEVCVFARVF